MIDLKPFAASARTSIEAAIADFQQQSDGVRAETAVTGLRLVEIAYDSRTLRVIAEAEGTVKVVGEQAAGAAISQISPSFAAMPAHAPDHVDTPRIEPTLAVFLGELGKRAERPRYAVTL